MKLGLKLEASLQQTLTPQQIQYLKLLQLPAMQFEQHVQSELENNPMLEEQTEESFDERDTDGSPTELRSEPAGVLETSAPVMRDTNNTPETTGLAEAVEFDPTDAFEFYKLIWGEDPSSGKASDNQREEEEDDETFQFKATTSFEEDFFEQLRFLPLTAEERLLGEHIIGNVDGDGYLRRDLQEIVDEVNVIIAEHNFAFQAPSMLGLRSSGFDQAKLDGIDRILNAITAHQAEGMVKRLQSLDPPEFASRTVQECLICQLRAISKLNAAQKLALMILTETYDAFAMKHFHVIEKQLGISEEYLREAIDVIRRLNPRPGGGTFGPDVNTVVPDFIIEREEDSEELLITVNDSRLPTLRVSNAYDRLKKEAKFHKFNKETREWLRKKYEDAKFLMQAIRQRKSTMLRVMTAIAGLQDQFFLHGRTALKPLIYRDVAEITGLDISTICRIVNGKYVLSEYGTFELKYFFSESLITDDGEEVSTRIIKQKIKELIEIESKHKPLSDDKLGKDLKALGYNVARRTVAKYREQLRIPVARLRREL